MRVIALLLVACSSTSSPDSAPPKPTANEGRVCQQTCATAADCAAAAGGEYRAANYACNSGFCHWLGCLTDADCPAQHACGQLGAIKTCGKRCTTPNDCANPESKREDADNWACVANVCRDLGCNNDEECASVSPGALCRKTFVPGLLTIDFSVRQCVRGCTTAADCTSSSPAFDADNYACVNGGCDYTECKSTDECRASWKPSFVCTRLPGS